MTKKLLLLCILVLASAPLGTAGVRHFTFVYEATTSPKGDAELENWVTWKRTTNPDDADEFEFRHEIEYGVTDRLQLAIYVADWFHERTDEGSMTGFSDSAIELIYNFTNPVVDPVGLSAYGEFKMGDHLMELESKFIAQKNLGRWILAYNATLEAVWEGHDLKEREGEITQSLGASYEFCPRFSVGVEALHEIVLPDWRDEEEIRNFFIGPNVSYRAGHWFVTVSALAQATDTVDEPDFQVRTIFGIGL